MAFLDAEMLPQCHELPYPGLGFPELRMSLQIGVAAADLIVHDQLTTVLLGKFVQHLEIVVGGAGTAVEQDQGLFVPGLFAHDAVIGLMPFKGQIAFAYRHGRVLLFVFCRGRGEIARRSEEQQRGAHDPVCPQKGGGCAIDLKDTGEAACKGEGHHAQPPQGQRHTVGMDPAAALQ